MSSADDPLPQHHEPALVEEVLRHLLPALPEGGLFVDGTVGAGGHALALLAERPDVRLFALDRDLVALQLAGARLARARFADRVRGLHASYADLERALAEAGESAPHAVLLDLGVSSMQIDDPARGFSFRAAEHAPDMRFDSTSEGPTALDIVNCGSERDLAEILHALGEEPRARAVARSIVRARPIRTVEQLRQAIARAALRVRRHDPATRSFQALRMAVNQEVEHLRTGLDAATRVLAPGGRLAVIAFHSGEERLVKAAFREAKREGRGHVVTKKPIRPGASEVRRNPRARPARLRVWERAGETTSE